MPSASLAVPPGAILPGLAERKTRLKTAAPFWNSRSHGLATVVLWSVPAFLLGRASTDASLLRSCSLIREQPWWHNPWFGPLM